MTTTTLKISGMTCRHCVAAVTEELAALEGVHEVTVDLVSGGASTVTVISETTLDDDAVRGAVDEAGYELADD